MHTSDAEHSYLDPLAGVLFTSLIPSDLPILSELQRQGTPFVQVLRSIEGVDADWIGVDDMAAGLELGGHMAGLGRRHVAVFTGPKNSSTSRNRALGMAAGLERAGVKLRNKTLMWGTLSRESGQLRARALFQKNAEVDAVMCGNDVIALGVLDVCREFGIDVPGDIAVSGFDDLSFASTGSPRLTTVTVPYQLMGRRALELLLSRIAEPTRESRREFVPYALQIRDSTVAA
jgi:LacI family transcriptional regulator